MGDCEMDVQQSGESDVTICNPTFVGLYREPRSVFLRRTEAFRDLGQGCVANAMHTMYCRDTPEFAATLRTSQICA